MCLIIKALRRQHGAYVFFPCSFFLSRLSSYTRYYRDQYGPNYEDCQETEQQRETFVNTAHKEGESKQRGRR